MLFTMILVSVEAKDKIEIRHQNNDDFSVMWCNVFCLVLTYTRRVVARIINMNEAIWPRTEYVKGLRT